MRKALRRWLATAAQLALGAGLFWMGADMAHAQAPTTTAPVDAAALYGTHCASCHGAQRTGASYNKAAPPRRCRALPTPCPPPK
jgi:mono/diheme cytochrome c family protein